MEGGIEQTDDVVEFLVIPAPGERCDCKRVLLQERRANLPADESLSF